MRRSLKTGLVVILVGVVIAALAKTFGAQSEEERLEGLGVNAKMKTVCIGRFLIDLPAEAQYELRGAGIGGFEIATFEESNAEFQERVLTRKAQLDAGAHRPTGRKSLELIRRVKNDHGAEGQVFVHVRDVTEGQSSDGLTVERYRYESVSIEALVHGDGISIDFSAANHDPESIGSLTKVITQIIPNPENRIPSEPGFCIDRAFIRDPLSADQGEQIMMSARLPNRPDIRFEMILAAGTEPDRQDLLERATDSDATLADSDRLRVKRLRANKRVIGGIGGEELVERFVEDKGTVVHSFWWEVNGSKDKVFVPHLVFKMGTGHSDNGPVPSSMSDAAAFRLWDKIASSIRLSPANARTAAQVIPPRRPANT